MISYHCEKCGQNCYGMVLKEKSTTCPNCGEPVKTDKISEQIN